VFKDPIVSFPFARQYTINPQETINVNDQYSPMPTVFEQQLEALYRNGGLFYLGQVDPSKNGQFFIETTSESSIRIDPDNSSNFVYSGYILNGPNVTIYPDISTLSLQFVNLEVTFNLRNFFLPSYWLSADNQLEPGLWITDTFLD
ncbi:MAG: hypothetical protein LBD63_01230, partial [Mycoplasmataceae bacterium]|nr:hypothetical protein [Mycoplasmataceae bacterium]